MRLDTNQSFSIPVITDKQEYYNTSIDFNVELVDQVLLYNLTCNSQYIDSLFFEKKVSFVVNVEGSNPAFRITHIINEKEGSFTIPKHYIKGNIDVTLLLVANENFVLESDEILFSGQYSVDKNQIIGYVPSDVMKISLDKNVGELISFNLSEKNIIEYNYSDSSIDIYLPKETFDFINTEKNNKAVENTLFNLYVFPALIAYLNKMKFEEDDSLLFNTFIDLLQSSGINIEDDNFVNKIPEYAANILNNTYSNIPKEITKLKDTND